MKCVALATVVLGVIIAGGNAIHLEKRTSSPAVVRLPIQRKSIDNPVQRDEERRRRKRALKVVSQTLDNFQGGSLYFANVTLGTPPQNFRFHLDTGSSDLWTNAASSRLCRNDQNVDPASGNIPCSVSGTYDANKSTSYNYVNSIFKIDYVDNTGARGDYVTDTLTIGGTSLPNLQFGVGYVSTSSEGVMGIGYPGLEVQQQRTGRTYDNIPLSLTKAGLINSPAYSLWLDDLTSATGSIMFGGVDTDKYHGDLATVPINPETGGQVLEMIVALSSIAITQSSSGGPAKQTAISSTTLPVLLDSGSTLSYLPTEITTPLYRALNIQTDPAATTALIDCAAARSNTTLDFSFSGKTIAVPLSQMVLPGTSPSSCVFGIFPQAAPAKGGSSFTLGDTFIRSAYLVYDLANNQISLAQTNFLSTTSNVMEIGTGKAAVPNASGVASAATAQVTGTATKGVGGLPGVTGTAAASLATSRTGTGTGTETTAATTTTTRAGATGSAGAVTTANSPTGTPAPTGFAMARARALPVTAWISIAVVALLAML